MSEKQAVHLEKNDFSVRLASILGAVTCVLAGILLALSIGASVFGWNFINSGPGSLLAGAYGMMAFGIPLYLFCAAWLLFDPVFRPGRIFLLAAALLPFLTIALGFSLIRDFEARRGELAFLDAMGRGGLSILIITATVLECVGILILKKVLFDRKQTAPKQPLSAGNAAAEEAGSAGSAGGTVSDTTENAAGIEDAGQKTSAAADDKAPVSGTEPYKLPDWEPLKSTAAFREANDKSKDEDVLVLDDSAFSPYSKLSGGSLNNENRTTDDFGTGDFSESKTEEPLSLDDFEEIETLEALTEDTADTAAEHDTSDEFDNIDMFDEADEFGEPIVFEELADSDSIGESEALDGVTGPIEENDFYELEQARFDDVRGGKVPESDTSLEDQFVEDTSWTEAEPSKDSAAASEPKAEAARASSNVKKKLNGRKGGYSVPVDILTQYPDGQYWIVDSETHREAQILKETLSEFGIQADITGIKKGPVITMFEMLPAAGVKLSKIVNLQDNIALRLAASSVRIVAPIPGKHAVGIEVPNKKRSIVSFREIIEDELNQKKDKHKNEIPVVLGKGITGDAVTVDLCQMPHILIAGATGSGKSVCVNSMILSILYQLPPAECRLILIDPKIVELKLYNDIPHLLTPVITEPKRAFQALQYCIFEMERRYACLDSMGVRDIRSYNKRIKERNIAAEHMPYIVVIIDEFADLMATTGKELESTLARLAAMSRAVGIHLVLATQRPSIDVITGLIKANIPSRIAFMVASKMDSRIIIDMVGAEKLLGKGDMLYTGSMDPFPIRMQGAFISEDEVERVVEYVKTLGEPEYIDDEIFFDDEEAEAGSSSFSEGEDPLYDKALEVVRQQGKASASFIQRRLKIGYNRAARLVEEMEERGVVGPAQGSKPRELLHGYSA